MEQGMKLVKLVTLFLAGISIAAPADAQLFYVGIRGGAGIPTGAFADTVQGTAPQQFLRGAKAGFGYGLDAGINLGPLGFYAGFDHIDFECEAQACDADSKYKLQGVSAGLRLSVPLFPLVKPWVKGGVTFNELEADLSGGAGASTFTSDRTPGYEIGAGIDIPIAGGFFSLTPQARYVGQKLDYDIPGVTSGNQPNKAANYYTFDIGLRLRTPM
jgi:opacity protein-like surface antigen